MTTVLQDDDRHERGLPIPTSGNVIDAAVLRAMQERRTVNANQDVPERSRRAPKPAFAFEVLPRGVEVDTELANAIRLQRMFGSELLFVRGAPVHAWMGTHYAQSTGEAERRAHEVAKWLLVYGRELYAHAATLGKDEREALEEDAKRYMAWARKSQSAKGVAAMLEIAATLDGFGCGVDDLDSDPMLFVCANGTIELTEAKLRESHQSDRVTKCSPVSFDRDARCPLWLSFLRKIFEHDDLIDYVQRACGYSMTGRTDEQCMFVLHGGGSNGKSTFLEVQRHVMGDYAQSTPPATLMDTNKSEHRNDVARLVGARFVTTSESAEGKRFDEQLIKQLTGGDMMTARFLRKEHFEFRPVLKPWMATNHKPEVRGIDHGFWRRMHLVPFTVTIADEDKDRQLPQKLMQEAEGILAWCVRGCVEWQKRGLQPPTSVVSATQEWRDEANQVAQFVEDCCVKNSSVKVTAGELYRAFREWSRGQGEPMSQTSFGKRLGPLGFQQGRSGAARVWLGIGLPARESDSRAGDA